MKALLLTMTLLGLMSQTGHACRFCQMQGNPFVEDPQTASAAGDWRSQGGGSAPVAAPAIPKIATPAIMVKRVAPTAQPAIAAQTESARWADAGLLGVLGFFGLFAWRTRRPPSAGL